MRARLAALLLLIAFAVPGEGYHINGSTAGGEDPHYWGAGIIVLDSNGNPIGGLAICEDNGDAANSIPSRAGLGGLCYMSVGSSGNPCTQAGVSNGNYPNYGPPGPCPTSSGAVTAVARNWIEIRMSLDHIATVFAQFTSRVNDTDCTAPAGTRTLYDDQWLHTVADGHMAGTPNSAPSGGLGARGTYTVTVHGSTFPTGAWNPCHGTDPWYQRP